MKINITNSGFSYQKRQTIITAATSCIQKRWQQNPTLWINTYNCSISNLILRWDFQSWNLKPFISERNPELLSVPYLTSELMTGQDFIKMSVASKGTLTKLDLANIKEKRMKMAYWGFPWAKVPRIETVKKKKHLLSHSSPHRDYVPCL